jgi:hypothetical protein
MLVDDLFRLNDHKLRCYYHKMLVFTIEATHPQLKLIESIFKYEGHFRFLDDDESCNPIYFWNKYYIEKWSKPIYIDIDDISDYDIDIDTNTTEVISNQDINKNKDNERIGNMELIKSDNPKLLISFFK